MEPPRGWGYELGEGFFQRTKNDKIIHLERGTRAASLWVPHGWLYISIALTGIVFGEEKAHSCEIACYRQLSFGHAETEVVAVWISHRKLAHSPRLINWRGVNWRLRTLCCIQTPPAKGHVTLINVVHKYAID